jgi:hypothetical protein
MEQFNMSDSALKAVGVGSVGTRCAGTVFAGDDPDDVLVLQGEHVVQGQRLMQTASDPEPIHVAITSTCANSATGKPRWRSASWMVQA